MKEQLRANAGLTSDERALLAAFISNEELEKRKVQLKKLKERAEEKHGAVMRFYDAPITEERKKELKDMVVQKRRMISQQEMEKTYRDLDKMTDAFNERF
jgi:ribosome recycling factor